MLPEGILFSTQTPPQASTTPRGEKGVFHHPPYRSYQKSNKIRSKSKSRQAYPKNTKNLDILTILASQSLPKTRLKPSEIEPKRPLGRLLDPLEPSWQQSLEKRRTKVAQETPRSSQNPPKTLPKPCPKLSKIHLKTHAKNTSFLEAFLSRYSSMLASKTSYFSKRSSCAKG